MTSLTRIVPWSHQLACEVLQPGDLAVDLTAGKGRDTLALARAVGPTGQVVSIDLQREALAQTCTLLRQHGLGVTRLPDGQSLPATPGVFLVQACHSRLSEILACRAKVIMANLGYLPGGDPAMVTQPATTLAALRQSLELLVDAGRLAVTVYPAHPGGGAEALAVVDFFSRLPRELWQVLEVKAANCSEAPFLLVAERLGKPG